MPSPPSEPPPAEKALRKMDWIPLQTASGLEVKINLDSGVEGREGGGWVEIMASWPDVQLH